MNKVIVVVLAVGMLGGYAQADSLNDAYDEAQKQAAAAKKHDELVRELDKRLRGLGFVLRHDCYRGEVDVANPRDIRAYVKKIGSGCPKNAGCLELLVSIDFDDLRTKGARSQMLMEFSSAEDFDLKTRHVEGVKRFIDAFEKEFGVNMKPELKDYDICGPVQKFLIDVHDAFHNVPR